MRVTVIGAGLGGLVAGYRLMQAGVDVTVLDAADVAGGVVGTLDEPGWLLETAAGSFLAAEHGLASLCRELDVPLVTAAPTAKRRHIFVDGVNQTVPTGPWSFARSSLLTWRGKRDLLSKPWQPSVAPGDESVHAFAARRFGPEAARVLFAPMVTGVYAASAHQVSFAAGFPRMAALDSDGGIVRGGLRAMWRARNKPRTVKGLHAPKAGMGAVVAALVKALGPRLLLGVTVEQIAINDTGVVIVQRGGNDLTADAAVLAVPARIAATLVDDAPELRARLASLTRAPVAVVYLGYAHPVAAAQQGFGVLVAEGEDPRVLGIIFESSLWPDRAPAGHTLLRCIYGGARDPEAAELDDATLLAQAEHDVATVLGERGVPVQRRVVRWRDGIAAYPVGHGASIATVDGLARRQRLVLAGADYHGISVNDLCADAARVVRDIAALEQKS